MKLDPCADGERLLVEEAMPAAAEWEVGSELDVQLRDWRADQGSDRAAHTGEEVARFEVERHRGAQVERQHRRLERGAESERRAEARALARRRIRLERL